MHASHDLPTFLGRGGHKFIRRPETVLLLVHDNDLELLWMAEKEGEVKALLQVTLNERRHRCGCLFTIFLFTDIPGRHPLIQLGGT